MHHPTDRIEHTTAFVTPVVEHWLERKIAQWVHHMKDRSDNPSHHERMPLPQSYISLPSGASKISNLLICFCSFDLSCPILEKYILLKFCILYCLVLLNSVLFKPCLFQHHHIFPKPMHSYFVNCQQWYSFQNHQLCMWVVFS